MAPDVVLKRDLSIKKTSQSTNTVLSHAVLTPGLLGQRAAMQTIGEHGLIIELGHRWNYGIWLNGSLLSSGIRLLTMRGLRLRLVILIIIGTIKFLHYAQQA